MTNFLEKNMDYIIDLVTWTNKNACHSGVYADVPNIGNRAGSKFRKKMQFLKWTRKKPERFLKHYQEWMDLLHKAYPNISTIPINATIPIFDNLNQAQIGQIRAKIIPTLNQLSSMTTYLPN